MSIIGIVKVDALPFVFRTFGVRARKSSSVNPGERAGFGTRRGVAVETMNGFSSFRGMSLSKSLSPMTVDFV
jgi:hypothetical protein